MEKRPILVSDEILLANLNLISPRNRAVLVKRLNGATLEEVGCDFDISRERVRQIVENSRKKITKKLAL